MSARIRNRLDEIIEKMYADASVADQLAFDRWPERDKVIARRAIALEIDKAGQGGSDADSKFDEAVEGVKVHVGELKSHIENLLRLSRPEEPASDLGVLRLKTLAGLAELGDAVRELEIAAEAEPE